MIIQLRHIWLRLGREAVLQDVTFDVAAGEGIALLGENGAGKTSLLRLLAAVFAPARGEGRICGFDLRDQRSVREHVHLLSHDLGLYPDLTPKENLRFALQMYGRTEIKPRQEQAALDRFGLIAAKDKRVRFLSTGMRRRVALARLSLLRPAVLLVDEPFANLDAAGRMLAQEVLSEAREHGATLLLAAHEAELARQVTDRTLIVQAGQVLV